MPTRSRKKKSEEKQSSLGITAFLLGEEETKKEETRKEEHSQKMEAVEKPEKKTTESKTTTKVEESIEELAEKIIELIRKRGGLISRDELVAWAKSRGIKLSTLMRAVEELTKRKVIVRRIVDEKLCYELRA